MKKKFLLYGKNTHIMLIIELIFSILIVIIGVIWMLKSNFITLLLMILVSFFFLLDFIKKYKFKLTLTDTEIIVSNDELPLSKKIQYYNRINYLDITNIYIEQDKLNSKSEPIKEYIYKNDKLLVYLTLQCGNKKNRIFISYLKDEELEKIIDLIINNINNLSQKKISLTGRDIIDNFIN